MKIASRSKMDEEGAKDQPVGRMGSSAKIGRNVVRASRDRDVVCTSQGVEDSRIQPARKRWR